MKTTKTTKKTVKPAFTVDMTGCETVDDLIIAIADAKLDAGLCISKKEFETILGAILEDTIEDVIDELFDGHNALIINEDGEVEALDAFKFEVKEKKPNVFKRFWNWLTRK